MRLFRQTQESAPEQKTYPANLAAAVMDAVGTSPGVPPPDGFIPEAPEWAPIDESEEMPSVKQLLKDPDVAAVVEAAGKGGCLLAIAED